MGLRPLVLAALLLGTPIGALAQTDPHHPETSPPASASEEPGAAPASDETMPLVTAGCPPSVAQPAMTMEMMAGMPMMQMMNMMQSMQATQQEMMRTIHLMQQQMMLMQQGKQAGMPTAEEDQR